MAKAEKITTHSDADLMAFGARFARTCNKNVRLFLLMGDLGAGKTTFAKGFARGLMIADYITSPTFTLINTYPIPKSPRTLVHMDAYRIARKEELEPLGLPELLQDPTCILLVEWADRFPGVFNRFERYELRFGIPQPGVRTVSIRLFPTH